MNSSIQPVQDLNSLPDPVRNWFDQWYDENNEQDPEDPETMTPDYLPKYRLYRLDPPHMSGHLLILPITEYDVEWKTRVEMLLGVTQETLLVLGGSSLRSYKRIDPNIPGYIILLENYTQDGTTIYYVPVP